MPLPALRVFAINPNFVCKNLGKFAGNLGNQHHNSTFELLIAWGIKKALPKQRKFMMRTWVDCNAKQKQSEPRNCRRAYKFDAAA